MEKYAVIEKDSIYHEGDERSRTNPGHGYPAWTEQITKIREFDSREKWEEWIKEATAPRFGSPKNFRAIVFREVEVETDVKIVY